MASPPLILVILLFWALASARLPPATVPIIGSLAGRGGVTLAAMPYCVSFHNKTLFLFLWPLVISASTPSTAMPHPWPPHRTRLPTRMYKEQCIAGYIVAQHPRGTGYVSPLYSSPLSHKPGNTLPAYFPATPLSHSGKLRDGPAPSLDRGGLCDPTVTAAARQSTTEHLSMYLNSLWKFQYSTYRPLKEALDERIGCGPSRPLPASAHVRLPGKCAVFRADGWPM